MVNNKENINRLLDLYFSEPLAGDFREIVQGWLLSGENAEAKEAALRELFEKTLNRMPDIDDYTRYSLAVLHDELGFSDRIIRSVEAKRPARRRLFRYFVGGTAAAAVIVGALVLTNLFNGPAAPEMTTIVADSGSSREILLPDSSTVTLQGGTTLAYQENGFAENRKLELDGEAFFRVAQGDKYPFVVSADQVIVTVGGTEFNMKTRKSEEIAEVVLKSGWVEVASGDLSVVLSPMQRATIDKTNHTITQEEIGEGEMRKLSGQNLSFENVSLAEALRQTGDYFDVAMHIATDLPAQNGLVVKLEKDATLNDVLFLLQVVNPVFDYAVDGDTVTITEK